ncbi:MAG TPA: LPD38 domain-containing protein, partial [Burkholderiaceae bacterium]
HEVIGHGGLRALRDKSITEAITLAGNNAFIRDLATAISADRGTSVNAIEEAVAELAAAIETDSLDDLAERYGVAVPAAARNGIAGAVARVIAAVKRFLATIQGKEPADVSDGAVRDLISQARAAVETGDAVPTAGGAAQALQSQAAYGKPAGQVAPTWEAPEPSKMDDALHALQDKHLDMKRVVGAVRKQAGEIADKWDPYLQEELYHGRTAKQVKDFLESDLRPLLDDMRMRGVAMDELETYLHNRHAEEANDQIAAVNPGMPDGGSGIDTSDARAYLAGLPASQRAAYEALAKRVYAINKGTRDLLVRSGLETASTIQAWEGAYQYYVPLMREDENQGMGVGQGFSVRGSASKRRTGSKKNVVDILANVAMARERAITRAEKNRIDIALYGLALQAPNPDFWLPVNPEKAQSTVLSELIRVGLTPGEAQNIIAEPTVTEIDPRTGLVTSRINPTLRNAPNVVSVRINGANRFIFFNKGDKRAVRMAASLKNLNAEQIHEFVNVVGYATRWFASVNTQYNPVFGAKNLARDVSEGLINLSATPLAGKQAAVAANVPTALAGIYADLRARRAGAPTNSTWGNLFDEFQDEGGQTGFRAMFSDSRERADAIRSEMTRLEEGQLKQLGRGVFDWLSDYNEAIENAVRLSAYKVAKEEGLSKQQAASLAKNLTVNFNRTGARTGQMKMLYAFFNAAIQGQAAMWKTLKSPAGKYVIGGGLLLGAMQAALMAAAGFDDDEPAEHVRAKNLVLPIGGGKYLSYPLPLGYAYIFNTGRIATGLALSGGKEPGKHIVDWIDTMFDAFSPVGNSGISTQTFLPTVADPLVALETNKDFTGRAIYKEDMNNLQPTPGHTRFKDTASGISKVLAEAVNWASGGTEYTPGALSPTADQIDYLAAQVGGGVARELIKTAQVVGTNLSGEELPPNKIPLVGSFYGETNGAGAVSTKFYSNVKQLNKHELEIKGRKEDRGDVAGYLRAHPEAKLVEQANQMYKQVSDLQREKRKAVDRGAGKDRVRLLDQQITARMRNFNESVELVQSAAR